MRLVSLPKKIALLRRFTLTSLLLLSLAVTFLAYQRGLSGPFVFDDVPNITKNSSIAIQDLNLDSLKKATFSSFSGPLQRPISMASFAINYYFTQFDPFYFKATNVVIHLLNGIGIFILTALLLDVYSRRFQPALSKEHVHWISLAVAAAWLLHPFNLTSVLYVVQRMTSLAAFFNIWGLAIYLWGRRRMLDRKDGIVPILVSLLIFMPLAALSKENGVLFPLMMLVTEITLLNFQAQTAAGRRFLLGVFIVTVAVPFIATIVYCIIHPAWLMGGYASRGFTMYERVLTEARVLWVYIRLILLPSIANMGLFHDDIAISHGLFQPLSTIFAVAGIAGVLAMSFIVRRKAPLIAFGILFFFAGHVLESTIFSLEIAHEHRNYFPMYGLVLILFFYMLYPLKYLNNLNLRRGVASVLIGLFAFSTFARATSWANPVDLAQSEVQHHPDSPRSNHEMGFVYANIISKDPAATEMNYLLARQFYEKATALDPNYSNSLFGLIILSSARGKLVEPAWIDELQHRLKNTPFSADTADKLIGLITCQMNGKCSLEKKEIQGLLKTALDNPTLQGPKRAVVLSASSYYLVNFEKDYLAAIAAMRQAIEAAPQDLEYRLNLIKFLTALERNEEAKTELDILKRMDKLNVYAGEIESQMQMLAQQGNNGTKH